MATTNSTAFPNVAFNRLPADIQKLDTEQLLSTKGRAHPAVVELIAGCFASSSVKSPSRDARGTFEIRADEPLVRVKPLVHPNHSEKIYDESCASSPVAVE